MTKKLILYRKYARNIKWFLVYSGLWPDSHPVFKKCLSILGFFSTFIVMLTVTNFCFHNATNIMVLTRGMGLAISFSSAFMKVCIFLLHHDDLVFLNKFLTIKYNRDLEDAEDQSHLLNRIAAFTYFMYIHSLTVGLTLLMYGISPWIALKKYGKYIRMYPAIFPFSYEPGGLVHWILYAIEVAGAWFLWTVTSGVDCAFGLYSLQMCGELRVLAKKFKNLRMCSDYKNHLVDCIQRHHMLIKSKTRLEDTFGLLAIWLAISGALVLCSLIFQVTEAAKSKSGSLHTGLLCCYIIPKFLQIFTYAWYGNLITDESKECLNSMFNADWPDLCDTRFKNDILIILSQEPLVLLAKGCMFIQLDMFVKIVNTSVSYFFLLQTLNESTE